MEAGTRQGRPRTGGTPGTTGAEEKTGFSLSTDTESCFSPIWRTNISHIDGELSKVLCRAEITEAWIRHLVQTRTPPPSGLLEEAEAEGSRDVVEVLKNLALQVQPCVENFPEESQNVRGTRLGERD